MSAEEVPEEIDYQEDDRDDDDDDVYDRDFAQSMPAHIAMHQSYGGQGAKIQKFNNPGVLTQSINMQKFVKHGAKQTDVLMSMLASQKPEKEERIASNQRKQSHCNQ